MEEFQALAKKETPMTHSSAFLGLINYLCIKNLKILDPAKSHSEGRANYCLSSFCSSGEATLTAGDVRCDRHLHNTYDPARRGREHLAVATA